MGWRFTLKLKIKRIDWLLADTCRKQPINALYFEFETTLTFYNLEAHLEYLYELLLSIVKYTGKYKQICSVRICDYFLTHYF